MTNENIILGHNRTKCKRTADAESLQQFSVHEKGTDRKIIVFSAYTAAAQIQCMNSRDTFQMTFVLVKVYPGILY